MKSDIVFFSVAWFGFFYLTNLCANGQDLLPGAALLFKDVNTKISDGDKNDIFSKTGIFYNATENKLTPGRGQNSKDFICEVLPTDMNKDGKEEIFISETISLSQKSKQYFTVFIFGKGQYQNAGKIEIPASGYSLFVYQSANLGYHDIGYNSPAKLYRFNGSEFRETNLKAGEYINTISDYSQDYASPLHTVTDPSIIAKFAFRNVKTKLTDEEKKLFTKDLVVQYRGNKDTSLKYVYDETADTKDLPTAYLEIFPADLNKDGVEEIFVRLSSSFFGPWLAPLNIYIKEKNGEYQMQDSIGDIAHPRLFARASGYGGYPDLIGSPPEGPGFYKIPTKFDVYRWNGRQYKLYKHSQPYQKGDKSIEEKISPAYQSALPDSLLRSKIVLEVPATRASIPVQQTNASLSGFALNAQSAEIKTLATSLFTNVVTKLSDEEKYQIAWLTGIKPEELNAKSKKGKSKFEVTIYPCDINKDGSEDIFLCVTTRTIGIPMNTYFFYSKNYNGKYEALPGKIGQGVHILLNGKASFPDLITGTPGLNREVWSWNGQTYRRVQNIPGTTAIPYKTKKIEDASKDYTIGK